MLTPDAGEGPMITRWALVSGTIGGETWPRGALSSSARPGPSARTSRPFPAGRCPTHVPTCWEKTTVVAVKIKLKRLGKIREPYYRIVVADARTKRDGRAIEEIGKYHPKADPSVIEVDSARVQHWLRVGAQPTDPVRHLLTITGDWQKFKGLPGAEGTLKTAEPKAAKKERYDTLVKESLAAKETKTAAKPARTAASKPAGSRQQGSPAGPRRPETAGSRRPETPAGSRQQEAPAGSRQQEAPAGSRQQENEDAPAEAKAAEAKAAEAKAAEAKAGEGGAAAAAADTPEQAGSPQEVSPTAAGEAADGGTGA